jgi:chorismate mutase
MPRGWLHFPSLGGIIILLVTSCLSPQSRLERLVAERLALAPCIAHAKWQRHLSIHDLQREKALLLQVRQLSSSYGLAPETAVTFFQKQISASKKAQQQCFAQWSAGQPLPPSPAPDLQKDLRPKLDRLTHQLLHALAQQAASKP